jgi:hypothetical protein
MTPETKAALIAKLQDDSVQLQFKLKCGNWADDDHSIESIINAIVLGYIYRIKPSTVSLPAVELPKPIFHKYLETIQYHNIFYITDISDTKFKTESDAQQWAEYLNSVLGCIKK